MLFCSDHDVARFATSLAVNGDSCVCYRFDSTIADACLTGWGEQVDPITYVSAGFIFSGQPLPACAFDVCDENPNTELCFTANRICDKTLYVYSEGRGIQETVGMVADSEDDCRVA